MAPLRKCAFFYKWAEIKMSCVLTFPANFGIINIRYP